MARGAALKKATLWLAVDAGASSAISIGGMLITAAIIGPEAVGLASIVLVITQLINFFVETLFADAIIQRKRLRMEHLDSAFTFLMCLGIILTVATAFSGPWAASVYGYSEIEDMLLVSALAILAAGASSVQAALMRRLLLFRALTIVNIVSRTLGSVVAIVLALASYGAWSLVAQYVVATVAYAVGAIAAVGWRPRFKIRLKALRQLLAFAILETMSQFVTAGRIRVFLTLAGATLPLAIIGQLNLAFRLIDSLRGVIASAIGRLSIIIFSRRQSNESALREAFLEMSRITALLTLPGFAALSVMAPEIETVIFGPRWNGLALHFQVLSVVAAVYFARSTVIFLMTAKGYPQVSLMLGLFTLTLTIGLFYVVSPSTPAEALLIWAGPVFIALLIEIPITQKMLRLDYGDQWRAISSGVVAALAVGLILWGVKQFGLYLSLMPLSLLLVETLVAAIMFGALVLRLLKGSRKV